MLACVAVPAQEWRLPPGGAVEYRRVGEAAGSAVVPRAAAARSAALSARVPERYFPRFVPAPWLCAGELRRDQRGLEGPVRDLRDVIRCAAFDLRGRGLGHRHAGVVPYGDLALSGSWRRADDGTESLTATVSARRPRDRLGAFCVLRCAGSLVLTRRVDRDRGVVVSFHGVIDVVVEEGERCHRRLRAEEAWQLVAVRENQDADFRQRVAAAISGGAEFVRASVAADRSYLDGKVEEQRSYGSGRLALALLTLLHAHVGCDDPAVAAGFRQLCRRRIVDAYSLAAALMAMARRGAAAGGQLSERERKVAQQWLDRLLRCVDPRTDRQQVLRFNYVAGPRYDTSVQQYGLLGLAAAQRCGLAVAGTDFAAAARHLLAVQCPSAGRHALSVVRYAELRPGEVFAPRPQAAACRGFAYVDPDAPPFGSMTSAGVSGLLLARDGMAAAGHTDRALSRRIDDATRDGFAWLAANFSVRCNPGWPERGRFHWYYWLYCLERSCELDRIARLDGRDWYYEGALQLLGQQQPGGAFRSGGGTGLQIDATCFAILFLAKAAGQAAITPR